MYSLLFFNTCFVYTAITMSCPLYYCVSDIILSYNNIFYLLTYLNYAYVFVCLFVCMVCMSWINAAIYYVRMDIAI